MEITYKRLNKETMETDDTGSIYQIVTYASGAVLTSGIDEVVTQTIRIDDQTVEDVEQEFDIESGEYVEKSRVQRSDPLPPPEPTPDDKIAALEAQNAELAAKLDQILAALGNSASSTTV